MKKILLSLFLFLGVILTYTPVSAAEINIETEYLENGDYLVTTIAEDTRVKAAGTKTGTKTSNITVMGKLCGRYQLKEHLPIMEVLPNVPVHQYQLHVLGLHGGFLQNRLQKVEIRQLVKQQLINIKME